MPLLLAAHQSQDGPGAPSTGNGDEALASFSSWFRRSRRHRPGTVLPLRLDQKGAPAGDDRVVRFDPRDSQGIERLPGGPAVAGHLARLAPAAVGELPLPDAPYERLPFRSGALQ